MAIAPKLERIRNAKQQIWTALRNADIYIPEDAPLSDYEYYCGLLKNPTMTREGLICYYDVLTEKSLDTFDPNQTFITDLSGNNRNGIFKFITKEESLSSFTPDNAYQWKENALYSIGFSTGIKVENLIPLDLWNNSSFTIEFIMQHYDNNTRGIIFGDYEDKVTWVYSESDHTHKWRDTLNIEVNGSAYLDNKLRLHNYRYDIKTTVPILPNDIRSFSYIVDKENSKASICVDGVKKWEHFNECYSENDILPGEDKKEALFLGSDYRYGSLSLHYDLYTFRIYNRVLTEGELAANYALEYDRYYRG